MNAILYSLIDCDWWGHQNDFSHRSICWMLVLLRLVNVPSNTRYGAIEVIRSNYIHYNRFPKTREKSFRRHPPNQFSIFGSSAHNLFRVHLYFFFFFSVFRLALIGSLRTQCTATFVIADKLVFVLNQPIFTRHCEFLRIGIYRFVLSMK